MDEDGCLFDSRHINVVIDFTLSISHGSSLVGCWSGNRDAIGIYAEPSLAETPLKTYNHQLSCSEQTCAKCYVRLIVPLLSPA
jgi:hypothetical protein